jgi:tRNA(Ile)-lysidine synthase
MENFDLLLETVRQSFLKAGEPDSLLAGISGGADSVALLIALGELASRRPVRLHAVHVNHGLRPGADEDEAFVRLLCKERGIPLIVRRVRVSPEGSLEAAARDARYAAFSQAADEAHTAVLVLAHHADDQAETVLMHLLRGAGAAGLGGMNEFARGIWRPFLGLGRDFLRSCLTDKGIAWREDPTNSDPSFFRNSLRIGVMPAIVRIAPQAVPNIGHAAEILRSEQDYFREYAGLWLTEHTQLMPPCRFLLTAPLLTEHVAAQRHILRVFCGALSIALTQEQTERLRICLNGKNGSIINLPGGFCALKTRERLHLIPPEPDACPPAAWDLDTLPFTGYLGNGVRLQAFDADLMAGAIVRARLPGDRFVPLGAGGSQTLKQYMIDHHIDRPFRAFWPCLAKGSMILWVIGVGVSGTAAISGDTQNKVMVRYLGSLPDEIPQRGR